MPRSFKPILGKKPLVLILGSMPGEASLKARQYYAHPQNQFWILLGKALGVNLKDVSYLKRISLLKSRRIALWDTLAFCQRRGSLDSKIRDEKPNPIDTLIFKTGVKTVFFNGRKAQNSFLKHFGKIKFKSLELRLLPSSSPAHASLSLANKLKQWRQIANLI